MLIALRGLNLSLSETKTKVAAKIDTTKTVFRILAIF